MSLHRYKDIFGRPREGLHAHRVLGFATVDLLATLLAATAGKYVLGVPLSIGFPLLIVASVGVHVLFGVQTQLTHNVLGVN